MSAPHQQNNTPPHDQKDAHSSPIMHATHVLGDGSGKALEGQAVYDTLKSHSLAWVHLDGRHPDVGDWLSSNIDYLDHIIIDALLAEETRPRILEFDKGALMILRGVNLNDNARAEDMISIRLWIDAERIISVQLRPLKATKDIHERLLNGNGPKDSGEFISALSARLFERMEPIFSELDEKLDDMEEEIADKPDTSHRQDVTVIRKQAIIFRRYIAPQRDVIAHLRTSEFPWLDNGHKRRLQESYDRVVRYVEDLDAMRERAQIIKDEIASSLADQMNRNMYTLSIVAAIFLPLGFLTGLLGINVGGMPGADYDMSFWIVCVLCIFFTFGLIGLFRFLKWL